MPSIVFLRLAFRSACTAGRMQSRTSVLFPDPLTPVTTVNRPSGKATERFFRLFRLNPRKMSDGVLFFRLAPRRVRGGAVGRAWPSAWPRSCCRANSTPVSDCLFRKICLSEPAATTWPPSTPAPGPRSMMWSARAIVSSSCSTTTTELPRERSCSSAPSSCRLSRGCRPIVGSSSTYSTPLRFEPSCAARRMRWASPPLSVVTARPSCR